ncbi:MAG: rhomboid family intramembrane serine protease [Lachnospiraceae bacterium]|nr:rhomboid family intramembrane serine protease [Lachnospiraceae bacterium]
MTNKLEYRLHRGRYFHMGSEEGFEDFEVFADFMERLVNVVVVVDAEKYRAEMMEAFKRRLVPALEAQNHSAHFMIILCVNVNSPHYIEQYTVAKQVCNDNSFAWIYEESEDKLIVFETQAEEFYGLRKLLEADVEDYDAGGGSEKEAPGLKKDLSFGERAASVFAAIPKATALIVLFNLLVFLVCTFTGELLYNIGEVGLSLVGTPDQWYRVITSMFLHSGMSHLFNNMLLLWFAGEITERAMGSLHYTFLYFVSGICGCLLTFVSEIISGKSVVMIGASGAVFGVLGALLALVIFKRVKGATMKVPRIAVVLILSIYAGFTETNVANWAHIGGLAAGFIFGMIFCLVKRNRE